MSIGKRMLMSASIVVFLFFTVIIWIEPGMLQSFFVGLSIFIALIITNNIGKNKNSEQK